MRSDTYENAKLTWQLTAGLNSYSMQRKQQISQLTGFHRQCTWYFYSAFFSEIRITSRII